MNQSIQQDLTKITDGIYRSSTPLGPLEIDFGGKSYGRFMDVFYLDRPTCELTQKQVLGLCRARALEPRLINLSDANRKVRENLTWFVRKQSPKKLLEIGCGDHPIIKKISEGFQIFLADADSNIVRDNVNDGLDCVLFSASQSLPFPDEEIDCILASFVFHFKIYELQVKEIQRCLSLNGLLLGNVYKRSDSSRKNLIELFERYGLEVCRVVDLQHACRDNEYWLIGKSDSIVRNAGNILKLQLENA